MPLLVEFAAVAGLQPPPLRVIVQCIAGEGGVMTVLLLLMMMLLLLLMLMPPHFLR